MAAESALSRADAGAIDGARILIDEALADRVHGDARGVMETQLAHEIGAMFFHGFHRQAQRVGDGLVGLSLADACQDLALARSDQRGALGEADRTAFRVLPEDGRFHRVAEESPPRADDPQRLEQFRVAVFLQEVGMGPGFHGEPQVRLAGLAREHEQARLGSACRSATSRSIADRAPRCSSAITSPGFDWAASASASSMLSVAPTTSM